MASPSNDRLFSHKREEEAFHVLIWNKPQGILLRKQSKLKMARICPHKCKNEMVQYLHSTIYTCICIRIYLFTFIFTCSPWKDTQETGSNKGSQREAVGGKTSRETTLSLQTLCAF